MSALDIRPHSRRVSGLAVAGLVLLGAGAFGLGVAHQLQPAGPSPFPPSQQPSLQIAAATPALQLQASNAVPTPVRHLSPEPSSDASAAADASSAVGDDTQAPPAVQTAAADASANAPDQAAPAAAPDPQPAPRADTDAAPRL